MKLKNKMGFIILLLDLLFVIGGIILLLIGFAQSRQDLASMLKAFREAF